MGLITIPDQFPGRCRNYRMAASSVPLRCLDYDGTPHVCKFPPDPYTVTSGHLMASNPPPPQPWVSPLYRED